MKPLSKILLGLWLSLCLLSGATASERYALVVGNGDYAFSPLKNPTNDAFDMAVALRQVGFNVRHLENVSRKSLRRSIREFGNDLSEGDVGLFFFAGHGVQSKGENYLIPIGADIEAEYDLEDEAVGVRTVLGAMEESGNHLNIVVLDACRNNPYRSFSRATNRGLAIVHAPRGTLVAFSTAPGQVAEDGTGRNSSYTKHLLAALATPNLSIEQVFKRVRVEVGRDTAGAQTPWEESSLMGDFYFTGEEQQTAAIAPTTTQPDQSAEVAFWQSIEDSDDPDMYQAYLTEFPDGKFVLLAKIKLKGLEKTPDETGAVEIQVAEEIVIEQPIAEAPKEVETTVKTEDKEAGCPEGTKQTYKGCVELSKAEADAAKAEAKAEARSEANAMAALAKARARAAVSATDRETDTGKDSGTNSGTETGPNTAACKAGKADHSKALAKYNALFDKWSAALDAWKASGGDWRTDTGGDPALLAIEEAAYVKLDPASEVRFDLMDIWHQACDM